VTEAEREGHAALVARLGSKGIWSKYEQPN
jgi:hypothetical protein